MNTFDLSDRSGKLIPLTTSGGHRRYQQESLDEYIGINKTTLETSNVIAIYCRVSSHEQKTKGDLDRPVSKEITEQWLNKYNFPAKKVINIDIGQSKADAAKNENVDIFIDDSFENFVDLNNNGIFTYLLTASWNIKYNVGHMRLNSLNDLLIFK